MAPEYATDPVFLGVIAVLVSATAFATTYMLTSFLIKYLRKNGCTVPDSFKKEKTMVAHPGGPAIIAGVLASEAVLYGFLQETAILAVMAVSFIAFLIGLVDDKRPMGGWYKPLTLAGAAVAIILLGAYETNLTFPMFGNVSIPLLYMGVLVMMIVVTGNTVNSIDVLNGVASGYMAIAGTSLAICLVIVGNYDIAVATLPLIFVSLAFYKYHKFPSRIFPGDSGALVLGCMYGTIAIVGGVEVLAAIALLPAIINSFLFLSGVKQIVEYRKIKTKPTIITGDFKIKATRNLDALTSLLQIITAKAPMTERQVAGTILRLGVFSGILAIITAFLSGVRI